MASIRILLAMGTAVVMAGAATVALGADVDAAAAESLARKSGCLKCHSTTREKEGPSYKKVAEKFKGQPDKLTTLVSHEHKIKVDGKEETHKALDTKDEAAIRNFVNWILSL